MYTRLLIIFIMALTVLGGGWGVDEAQAANCYGTTIDEQACDTDATDGSTDEDICMVTGGGFFIDCCLDRISGGTTGGTLNARMVSGRFEFSGQDWNGNDFCCLVPMPTNNLIIRRYGSEYDDTFDLDDGSYPLAAGPTYSLQAEVRGDDGEDTITGSSVDTALYSEILYGEGDDDDIDGEDGDDVINGGEGVDTCHGGEGDDQIYGEGDGDFLYGDEDEDELWGGGDDDTLYGGSEDDVLHGGDDDDDLYGGAGDDALCGDDESSTGNDYLDGGTRTDTLWGVVGNTCQYGGCVGAQNQGPGQAADHCDSFSVGTYPYGSTCNPIDWAPHDCL